MSIVLRSTVAGARLRPSKLRSSLGIRTLEGYAWRSRTGRPSCGYYKTPTKRRKRPVLAPVCARLASRCPVAPPDVGGRDVGTTLRDTGFRGAYRFR
jgi:hypothetical protein